MIKNILFYTNSPLSLMISLFYSHHRTRRTHITYLLKSLEPVAQRERCVMTLLLLAVCFKSLWDLIVFFFLSHYDLANRQL